MWLSICSMYRWKDLTVYCMDVTQDAMFWEAPTASGFLGLAISFTSMWFLHQTGPTTYSLVVSFIKVPISLSGLVLFDVPLSLPNLFSIHFEPKCHNRVSKPKYNSLQNLRTDGVPFHKSCFRCSHCKSTLQARFWKQYVETQMAVNNDDATKQIFSRCLLTCLQVPLWQCYIRFIRKVYDKKGAEGQEETTKAFEFTLNYIGTDIASGPIWTEYITFLKSLPALNPHEDMQRKIALRKVYQRAILTPTHHVEQLWKEYENFENSVNRQLAKGLVNDYQPKFNSARAVYRERKKYIEDIDWNMLAVPPTGSSKEEVQWVAWKKFLTFEKGNPQRIDTALSTKRIIYVYEQCLMCLYHYPDVWYDYAEWHIKSGSTDAAIKVFQRALKAIPDSEMLKYAYAELEEARGAIQSAKNLYESILGVSTNSLAQIQFLRFLRRAEGVESARKYFLEARKSPSCTYHVYIAFATMAFCLDKDPKVQEKKIKKISEMNIDPSKTPGQPSSSSPPPVVANGVHADPAHDYLSKFSFPPGGLPSLRLPVVTNLETSLVARCRRVYAHAHDYHINSISNSSDGETFISADDLRVNLWNLEISNQSFNIVDVKPTNMEDLTEVITSAEFHPIHCNMLAYSSSKGSIRLIDMRQSALCDSHTKL
ncbi:hypothetical protein F2Q70_00040156 [Brassica cretica]|uniref:Suppressor of forked domain-containing protein n=1 Tax=Brassica cretica TaxID=69181 RepID=A0A8S9KCI8_BRACR|nr:hypothetical protein F2Q70_00040156 [Brassica cretica]